MSKFNQSFKEINYHKHKQSYFKPSSQPSPRGEGAFSGLAQVKAENCGILSPLGEIRKGVKR
jgi:hypothetical protein